MPSSQRFRAAIAQGCNAGSAVSVSCAAVFSVFWLCVAWVAAACAAAVSSFCMAVFSSPCSAPCATDGRVLLTVVCAPDVSEASATPEAPDTPNASEVSNTLGVSDAELARCAVIISCNSGSASCASSNVRYSTACESGALLTGIILTLLSIESGQSKRTNTTPQSAYEKRLGAALSNRRSSNTPMIT